MWVSLTRSALSTQGLILLFITCFSDRQFWRGCWGELSTRQTYCSGRGLDSSVGMGMGRVLKGCRWRVWWGGRLWVAVLFVFQIEWGFSSFHWNPLEGNGGRRSDSPAGSLCILGSMDGLPKGHEFWSPWNYKYKCCVCVFFGANYLYFLSASQRSWWPKHVKNPWYNDQSISKLSRMNQFFMSLWKRRFSNNCFLSPPFSPLPDVIFKRVCAGPGRVAQPGRASSQNRTMKQSMFIYLSIYLCTYLSNLPTYFSLFSSSSLK